MLNLKLTSFSSKYHKFSRGVLGPPSSYIVSCLLLLNLQLILLLYIINIICLSFMLLRVQYLLHKIALLLLHEIMVIWTLKANKIIVVFNKGTSKLKCNNNTISQLQCVKTLSFTQNFLNCQGKIPQTQTPFSVGVQLPGVFVQDYIPPLENFLST